MEQVQGAMPLDKDALLQRVTPVVPVPRFGTLVPDERDCGHRYLIARDGMYVEATRPWLYAIGCFARGIHQTPFGAITEKVELRCGAIPKSLLRQFIGLAQKALPNETSAAFVWNHFDNTWRIVETAIKASATPGSVQYVQREPIADNESMVVDIHSHGNFPAFFSEEDNRDDATGVKVAVVIGRVDNPDGCELKARVCFFGIYVALDGLC